MSEAPTATDIDWELPFIGFGGGLNLRDPGDKLEADDLRRASNVTLDETGGIAGRSGCKNMGTITGSVAGDRIISIYEFMRAGATTQILAHMSDGRLMYTTDSVNWTQIVAGLSTTAPLSFETFNTKCYFSNGVNDYASWDGTTYTAFPTAPKGKYLRLWKDTMWSSGVTGTPDRVYSSDPGNAEIWPALGFVDIAKGDGDQVKSLATDGTFLIVAKRRRMWVIADPITFSNRLVDYEKGCESHFSWVACEGLLYFLSANGIYAWANDQPAVLLSDKLNPIFSTTVLNYNLLELAWAYTFEGRVGWTLPELGATAPSFQIELYPRLPKRPWTTHRMPIRCFTRYRSGTVIRLYGGSTISNKMLNCFDSSVGTDDGVAYVTQAATGWFDLQTSDLSKYLRRMRIVGRGAVTITPYVNFSNSSDQAFVLDLGQASTDLWTTGDTWGVGTWGPGEGGHLQEQRVDTDIYFRQVSLSFRESDTGIGQGQVIRVAGVDYTLPAGRWAVYTVHLMGMLLGPGR